MVLRHRLAGVELMPQFCYNADLLATMTTSTSLSGSAFSPKPPAKGSFPLDHLGECKDFAVAYEQCLERHKKVSSECRSEARLYLQCRMERGLMATEEWKKLGLDKEKMETGVKGGEQERPEATGFVAGARSAKRRKDRYNQGRGEETG